MQKSSNNKHQKTISSPQIFFNENIKFNSQLNLGNTFKNYTKTKMLNTQRQKSSEKITSLKYMKIIENNPGKFINPPIKLKLSKNNSFSRPPSTKISKHLDDSHNPQTIKQNLLSEIDTNLRNINEEAEEMNKSAIRKKEIAALLKTTLWEKENLLKNKTLSSKNLGLRSKNTIEVENGEFNLNFKTQIESINAIAMMKEKMTLKEKTKEYPRILKDLLSRETENEQKTIIKHIFHNKQNFNFNIFNGKNLNNDNTIFELNSNLEILNENNDRHPDTKKKENNFDFLLKFEENEMINENKIYDIEQYKQLIREKNKVEMIYRKQLMQIAQEIFELKIKKRKLEDSNSEVHHELKRTKDEFLV